MRTKVFLKVFLHALVAALLANVLAACEPEVHRQASTQVVVRLHAAPDVLSAMQRMRVRVAGIQGGSWGITYDKTFAAVDLVWPVDIVVVPRSRASRYFEVIAEALAADGRVLVQARGLSGFVPHQQRVFELTLARCGTEALGFVCETDERCLGSDCKTCVEATCQQTPVTAPEQLAPLTPPRGLDAGATSFGTDAATHDGGSADGGTYDSGADPTRPSCEDGTRRCGERCIPEVQCCSDEDCPKGATCEDGVCQCPSGTHPCGERCVSDTSPESCGQSCEPCAAPLGGGAECGAGECVPTCPSGERPCAGECIPDTQACSNQCPSGSHDCSGVCLPNTSVNGCGTSCSACPAPLYGSATCDGTRCDFECDGAHRKCGTRCIELDACCGDEECPAHATCQSDVCTCAPNYRRCGSECIPQGACCVDADCQPNAACSGGSCSCKPGFKACGTACIANSACCEDGDCPQGTTCDGGSCKTWCGRQKRPAGVAVNDYQCLDFEEGLPPTSTWDRSTSDTASLGISTVRASSPPNSLLTRNSGELRWSVAGSTEITGALVSAQISPLAALPLQPNGVAASLICFETANAGTCLSYAYRFALHDLTSTVPDYTGLFLSNWISAGAFIVFECPLNGLQLNMNVWNTVTIDMREGSEAHVTVNGQSASCTGGFSGDTNGTIALGVQGPWTVGYDNVVLNIYR